jgi:SanA protein
MKIFWKISKITLVLLLLTGLSVFVSNYWVFSVGKFYSYNNIEDLDYRDVALVLGTSRSVDGRIENPFFTHRIKAAAELYHAGKVKHFILSGDNSNSKYNEPLDMKKKLIQMGVPAEAITMDFAGRRTLDSVIRCKEIFQQNKVIIISQAFHNYRALFIARYHGMDAIGFNAKYPKEASYKTLFREYLARPKAILDLYILKKRPKIMGDKEDIGV